MPPSTALSTISVLPFPSGILRVLIATVAAYTLASIWTVPAPWVVAKLLLLSGAVLLSMLIMGELKRSDLTFALSLLKRKTSG